MNKKTIERIEKMEHNLDTAQKAIKDLNASIVNYLFVQNHIKELAEYYGSSQWLEDYDADCSGLLPEDLKRGVLSQDAVYNLLCENDKILKVIQNISDN